MNNDVVQLVVSLRRHFVSFAANMRSSRPSLLDLSHLLSQLSAFERQLTDRLALTSGATTLVFVVDGTVGTV